MPQSQQTKKYKAYEAIKAMILLHHARPEDPFTELSLSQALEMGRTPIREALNLLEKDGLIYLIPNKGFILKRISSDDLIRLYQVREVLDGLAAKHAAPGIDISELDRIENKYLHGRQPDWESARQLSCELHPLIYRSCGNSYLVEVYESLRLRIDLGMNSLWQLWIGSGSTDLMERRNREHAEIIQYLKDRDGEGAERMSREHISNVIKDILYLIAGQRMG
jgi:DNA-binding GntR family transcriptional regulator